MNDGLVEAIGAVAGILTTVSFLPQVVKSWRSGSTRDLSLTMFLSFCVGVALWLVYGALISSWPVVVANFITLVLAGFILALKIRDLRHR